VVITEHPAEALSPSDWTKLSYRGRPQELVCQTLMIALSMVVSHEVGDRELKRGMPEEDHAVQALGFYRAHETFGECIQIRRSRPESNEVDALAKDAIFGVGDIACNLHHPSIVGVGCDAGNVDRSRGNVDEEEDVVVDQPLHRVYLVGQEVGHRQALFACRPRAPRGE